MMLVFGFLERRFKKLTQRRCTVGLKKGLDPRLNFGNEFQGAENEW